MRCSKCKRHIFGSMYVVIENKIVCRICVMKYKLVVGKPKKYQRRGYYGKRHST